MWRDCDRRELVGLLDEGQAQFLEDGHVAVCQALRDAADACLWASDFVDEDAIRRFDDTLLGLLKAREPHVAWEGFERYVWQGVGS